MVTKIETGFKSILSGASYSFFFKVGGTGAVFLFSLLLSRQYGASEAGLFFIIFSANEFLAMVSRLGLAQSSIALVGKCYSDENWREAKGIIWYGFSLILIISTIEVFFVYLLSPLLAVHLFSDERLVDLLRLGCLAVPAVALIRFVGNAMQGLHRIPASQFVVQSSEHLLLLIAFMFVFTFGDIKNVILAYVVASWVALAVSCCLLYKVTLFMSDFSPVFNWRKVFRTAMPLLWTNVMMILNSRASVFALGILVDAYNVGVYCIALRISLMCNFILMAVNAVSAPKFASLHRIGNWEGVERVLKQSTRLAVIVTIPTIVPILLYPEFFLSLFGSEFVQEGAITIVLIIGQCFNVASGPVGMLLAMTGYEKQLRNVYLYTTPVNIVLQIVLISYLGALGGAIATSVFVVVLNVCVLIVVKRKLGMTVF